MSAIEKILNELDDTRETRYEKKLRPKFTQFVEDWFQYIDEVDYV